MRASLLVALLGCPVIAWAGLAPADIQAPVLITRVDCHIVIDKSGRIADYAPITDLPTPIAERVRDMVRAVRFEPVVVDGKVVNAATDMRVAVTATRLGDGGLRLALDNVTFPKAQTAPKEALDSAQGARKPPPIYPAAALRAGASADVLAIIKFDAGGRVVDAAIQQSALVHMRALPADAARVLDLFEKSTLGVLRQWQVLPAAMPADTRVGDGFVVYVPVNYRMADGREPGPWQTPLGEWSMETRTVRRDPGWLAVSKDAPQPGVSDLADGEMTAANRDFRLAEPLPGAGS